MVCCKYDVNVVSLEGLWERVPGWGSRSARVFFYSCCNNWLCSTVCIPMNTLLLVSFDSSYICS